LPSSVSQSIGSWKGGSTAANDLWDSRIKLGGRQKKILNSEKQRKASCLKENFHPDSDGILRREQKRVLKNNPFLDSMSSLEFLLELLLFWDDKRKGWRVISLFSRMNLNKSSSYYLYAQMFSFYVWKSPPPRNNLNKLGHDNSWPGLG
jgi:hypothetical protein